MRHDPETRSIARRLFITNAVDSVLSTIGIVTGTSASHVSDPKVYISAALGGALSLGLLSGFLGVYLTERAEKVRELQEIEKAMLADLSNSVYAKTIASSALYVAFWSLLGSLLMPIIALLPFFVGLVVRLPEGFEVSSSLVIAYSELVSLGLISGRSLRSALLYLGLGLIATALVKLLGWLLI